MLELSTPVVTLWEGILALPLIGTLDSARTQVVMENLLQRIVETGSTIAIIDITGVPTVDTLVAQHLLKTVAAARLMGADCIISGIRPQIAQTIVHLGVDLDDVTTKATLADAFAVALQADGRPATVGPRGVAAPPPRRSRPMERIPILKMGELLLVTIQVDMHDRLALTLQDDLTTRIAAHRRARRADRHLRRSRWSTRSSAACSATSPRWRACSTPRPSSSACGPRSRSRWSSSACRSPGVRTALDVEKGMDLLSASVRSGRRKRAWRWSQLRSLPLERVGTGRHGPAAGPAAGGGARVQPRRSDEDRHRRQRARPQHGPARRRRTRDDRDGERRRRRGLRLTFEDRGPGIADIEQAMKDGYSTAADSGLGLSGAKRLSNEFSITSAPGQGTRVSITRWKL